MFLAFSSTEEFQVGSLECVKSKVQTPFCCLSARLLKDQATTVFQLLHRDTDNVIQISKSSSLTFYHLQFTSLPATMNTKEDERCQLHIAHRKPLAIITFNVHFLYCIRNTLQQRRQCSAITTCFNHCLARCPSKLFHSRIGVECRYVCFVYALDCVC